MLEDDFDTLVPAAGSVNRRSFVQGALGSGFAASVLPVMAQTEIKTGTTGLVAGEVTIPVGDYPVHVAGLPHGPVLGLAWFKAYGAA